MCLCYLPIPCTRWLFQFGMFETMTSSFVDEFPQYLKGKKTLFTATMCVLEFLIGIPIVTQVKSVGWTVAQAAYAPRLVLVLFFSTSLEQLTPLFCLSRYIVNIQGFASRPVLCCKFGTFASFGTVIGRLLYWWAILSSLIVLKMSPNLASQAEMGRFFSRAGQLLSSRWSLSVASKVEQDLSYQRVSAGRVPHEIMLWYRYTERNFESDLSEWMCVSVSVSLNAQVLPGCWLHGDLPQLFSCSVASHFPTVQDLRQMY